MYQHRQWQIKLTVRVHETLTLEGMADQLERDGGLSMEIQGTNASELVSNCGKKARKKKKKNQVEPEESAFQETQQQNSIEDNVKEDEIMGFEVQKKRKGENKEQI